MTYGWATFAFFERWELIQLEVLSHNPNVFVAAAGDVHDYYF